MKSLRDTPDRGFTLIELLVVVGLIALIAGLAAPAFKTKTMGLDTGHRQLAADLNRARQLAISTRSTVYVLFAPLIDRNFTVTPDANIAPRSKDVFSKHQVRGYAIYSNRSVGSQPGQIDARYLSEWKLLPEGVCIATNKFMREDHPSFSGYLPMDYLSSNSGIPVARIHGTTYDHIPYIAFDYTGALTLSELGRVRTQKPGEDWKKDLAARAVIPLVAASVSAPKDINRREAYRWEAASVLYKAPWDDPNANKFSLTNYFKRVVVDPLTGRSRVEGGQITIPAGT